MNMEAQQLDQLPRSSTIASYRNPKGAIPHLVQKTKKKQIGILEVYIHQARDIPNICIYHKQDVYAKIYLTSDPETTIPTQIIPNGGQEPVFDETLHLSVQTLDSSLKCEIWMLSRIKNYLQDQLLGSASVPLLDVVRGGQNGKISREFSLSSSDLLNSQAGFVRLSLAYIGGFDISRPTMARLPQALEDSDMSFSVPCELEKIVFPDPKIACENEMMVSEYLKVSCGDADANPDEGSSSVQTSTVVKPVPKSVEFEAKKVVQQDIIDMYMKSMEQFTEKLANLKLPLQIDYESGGAEERWPKEEVQPQGSRVFYGSHAFF